MNVKLLQAFATTRKAIVVDFREQEDKSVTFVLSNGQKLTMTDAQLQTAVDEVALKLHAEEAASAAALEALTAKAKKHAGKKE
jgi:hypothetical protein